MDWSDLPYLRIKNSILSRKQEMQFYVFKLLTKLGLSNVSDPLFKVKLHKGRKMNANRCSGTLGIYLRSTGLLIKGSLELKPHQERPKCLYITLNGKTIRKERLSFKENRATFSFSIKRPTLAHFPREGRLEVKTSL